MDEVVFIGVGGNSGGPAQVAVVIGKAEEALRSHPQIRELVRSPMYVTPPWGESNQPSFLNAVFRLKTGLSPHELLAVLKWLEGDLGRVETYRWGPRVIDLDILLYGQRKIATEKLVIPHRYLLERPFAYAPLLVLEPEVRLPEGKFLREMVRPPEEVELNLFDEDELPRAKEKGANGVDSGT